VWDGERYLCPKRARHGEYRSKVRKVTRYPHKNEALPCFEANKGGRNNGKKGGGNPGKPLKRVNVSLEPPGESKEKPQRGGKGMLTFHCLLGEGEGRIGGEIESLGEE